jgi:hypothetical protein
MRIYLLTQAENHNFDTFNSAVVVADSCEDARAVLVEDRRFTHGTWCEIGKESCYEIGIANEGEIRGIVCASYRAG